MRRNRSKPGLETLEGRALLTTAVSFIWDAPQVVNDRVGTVDLDIQAFDQSGGTATPQTVTINTSDLTAAAGVDYTPVSRTITVDPNISLRVSIPILPGPASLGTRSFQVSLSPSPGAPQGSSLTIFVAHGSDADSPYVVSSQTITQGGNVVAFAVKFNEPMAAGPASDVSNYSVASPRSAKEALNAVFDYGGGSAYSSTIPLKSAVYDAASDTVYLIPLNKLKPNPKWRFPFQVVSPSRTATSSVVKLKDLSGNPIATGEPGNMFSQPGRFAQLPLSVKASPALLTQLVGTPATPAPKGHPKPIRRHK